MRWLCLVCLWIASSTALAQPPEDKLDMILNELRALTQQVDVLEGRLRAMQKQAERAAARQPPLSEPLINRSGTYRRLQLQAQPQEILRMQFEEPASLLKNIHERERELRNRNFPAELFFYFPK